MLCTVHTLYELNKMVSCSLAETRADVHKRAGRVHACQFKAAHHSLHPPLPDRPERAHYAIATAESRLHDPRGVLVGATIEYIV